MFNTWHLIACAVIASTVSASVCSILWRRSYDRLSEAWARDHCSLDDRIEELEAELVYGVPFVPSTPEEKEAAAAIQDYMRNPDDFELVKEETPGGLFVTVRLKDKEVADYAETDP